MKSDRRGVVYLETLIAFFPVFGFFIGTLQIADMGAARLIVEHAATTTARAAVVVLPDDGLYYEDRQNELVDQYTGLRRQDIEHAANLVVGASPRLSPAVVELYNGHGTATANGAVTFAMRDPLIAKVSAHYHCLLSLLCPGGLELQAQAELTYQGASYDFEINTAVFDNARPQRPKPQPGTGDDGRSDEPLASADDPAAENDWNGRPDDDPPFDDPPFDDPPFDDPPLQPLDALKAELPDHLSDIAIRHDPNLHGSTVEVHFSRNRLGVITGIEIHAGHGADLRHIRDHVATVETMRRYQGAIGTARALGRQLASLITGHPNMGPGSRAFEVKREIEKLEGILADRAQRLEDPNLSAAERAQLEREVTDYIQQLEGYRAIVETLSDEAGLGYVAARDSTPDLATNQAPTDAERLHAVRTSIEKENQPELLQALDHPFVQNFLKNESYDLGALRAAWKAYKNPDRKGRLESHDFPSYLYNSSRYRTTVDGIADANKARLPAKPLHFSPPREVRASFDPLLRERKRAQDELKLAQTRRDQAMAAVNLNHAQRRALTRGNLAEFQAVENQLLADGADGIQVDALMSYAREWAEKHHEVNRLSERIGHEMAEAYIRERYNDPSLQPIYDGSADNEGSGNFDLIWIIPANGEDRPVAEIILVEAKGGVGSLPSMLGSRKIAGVNYQQGSLPYALDIAQNMLNRENLSSEQRRALEDAITALSTAPSGAPTDPASGQPAAPLVRYWGIHAPIGQAPDGTPTVKPGEVYDFLAPPATP